MLNHAQQENFIKQKPLGEVIANELRYKIWSQEFNFGERLIEAELAEQFDVSRSSLREALRILEHEKLVINKVRKGTFVNVFTEKDKEEINEVRLLLEVPALIQAASHLKEEHVFFLEEILESLKIKVDEGNWYDSFNLDVEFHLYLINLCNNSRIIEVYNMILVQIRTIITSAAEYYDKRKELYYTRHVELLEAIKAGNNEKIKKLTENHIEFLKQEKNMSNKSSTIFK
jgi:DNA-binding GntR family transcriptional regulator